MFYLVFKGYGYYIVYCISHQFIHSYSQSVVMFCLHKEMPCGLEVGVGVGDSKSWPLPGKALESLSILDDDRGVISMQDNECGEIP